MTKINHKKFYYIYTVLACLLLLCLFCIHLSEGKSSIWENDAIKQHYISLAYYGNYLREILKNIFVYHTLEIPMWDIHIGYGTDIITTLHYYVFGDPLNLLAVFVPEKKTEYLYEALIFLRIYLAGITFSRFCFFHNKKEVPVLIGTFIYISSMWMISVGFNHIFFLMPTLYFPLVLLGVDKILAGKKPFVYISSLAVSALSNYYFFYMIGIFTVLYACIRYFVIYKKWIWKKIISYIIKFFLYSVLGISISGVILLPVIMRTIHTERFGGSYYIPELFSKEYYKELPVILTSSSGERYTLIGVAGVCALSLIILFLKKRKYKGLKAAVLLTVLFYCIPYAGHVLNGFSYVSNRWSWAAVLLFSYLFVVIYPEFFRLTRKERWILVSIAILYGGYVIWFPQSRRLGSMLAGLAVILPAILLLFAEKKKAIALILAGSVGISTVGNICYVFMLKDGVWMRPLQNLDIGSANELVHKDVYKTLKNQPEISDYRYEQNTSTIYNTAMLNGLNSGQFYFSLAQEGVGDFFEDNYVASLMEQVVLGLNNRAWLMKLFSVKYCIEDGSRIPYGYQVMEPQKNYEKNTQIYEDSNPLTLAYTYDSYIPEEMYHKMEGQQRQEAMLQGVVLENSNLPICETVFSSEEVPYKVEKTKGVEIQENCFVVSKRNAECLLDIRGKKECETYIAFDQLEYGGFDRDDSGIFETPTIDNTNIVAETYDEGKEGKQSIYLRSYKNEFQDDRESYMANLGYFTDDVKKIKLTFTQPGIYSFKKMRVICQEMDTLNFWTNQRKADPVKDFQVQGNRISCNLSIDQEKALVFSIPYSTGWSAKVDGNPVQLKKANVMFMALELQPGYHEIELQYATPYIYLGLWSSILGLLVTLFLSIYKKI